MGFWVGFSCPHTTWSQQAPDVALQFFLAQTQRQRLREQHQVLIQEEQKNLKQEEMADDQAKSLVAGEEVRGVKRGLEVSYNEPGYPRSCQLSLTQLLLRPS